MAKLGDAFSDEQRRESARRQLQPGTIIYLEVVFPEGPRSKYLVVAHVDEECCTFVVNSRIRPFIETHPSLAVCQVKIDAAGNGTDPDCQYAERSLRRRGLKSLGTGA